MSADLLRLLTPSPAFIFWATIAVIGFALSWVLYSARKDEKENA